MWADFSFSMDIPRRMEQRQHLRIQIPLGVEITHPAIGTQTTTARDISEGGVFVRLATNSIAVGAKVKIKVHEHQT